MLSGDEGCRVVADANERKISGIEGAARSVGRGPSEFGTISILGISWLLNHVFAPSETVFLVDFLDGFLWCSL